jgi:hypothetical protein
VKKLKIALSTEEGAALLSLCKARLFFLLPRHNLSWSSYVNGHEMKRNVVMFVLFLWALSSAKAQVDVSLHESDGTPVSLNETVADKPVSDSVSPVLTDEEIPPSPTVFGSFTAAIPTHLRRLQVQEVTGSLTFNAEEDYSELIARYTCQQDFNLDENVDEIVLLKNKDGKGGVLACLCSIGDGFSYLELEVFTAAQFATQRLEKSYVRSFCAITMRPPMHFWKVFLSISLLCIWCRKGWK